MTVAKHLLIKIVQPKGFICQSHAANNQDSGVQSSLPCKEKMANSFMQSNYHHHQVLPSDVQQQLTFKQQSSVLGPDQGTDKRFTVVTVAYILR